MFAVFGITPASASKKVRVPLIDKSGRRRSLAEVEADRAAKVQRLLEKGRPVQLSEVYGVLACAHQFADLALKSGGVQLEVRQRVADGERFDKRKKCSAPRHAWKTLTTVGSAQPEQNQSTTEENSTC